MDILSLVAKLSLDTSEYENGLKKAEGDLDANAQKMQAGIGKFATAGAAALGAFAVASVKTGAQFDSSMAQVAATMGVTVDEIQDLRVFAQEMGATTAFSASQAADALNYMALAGYDAETSMSMLPNVLNLAAAGGMELATASDMITDASSALGLSIEDTTIMVDQMAKASSKSNTSVAQLGDAILTVGGTAKNLAGGTTELTTALGIMADSGIKGSESGTHLRNILLALNPTTKDAKEAFEDLKVSAYDVNGNLRPLGDTFSELAAKLDTYSQQERTDIIGKIFNKADLASVDSLLTAAIVDIDEVRSALNDTGVEWDKYADKVWASEGVIEGVFSDIAWNLGELKTGEISAAEMVEYLHSEYEITMEDAAAAVKAVTENVGQQQDRWQELSGYIDDATGAAQQMADTQLDSLEGDVTKLKSAFEGMQINLSEKLTPSLRTGTQALTAIISNFEKFLPIVTGAATAVGVFAIAINFASIVKTVTTSIAAFNAVLAANPIGIVVALIAGLVIAITTLWKTNDTFREKVTSAWNAITGAGQLLHDKITGFFSSVGDSIKNVVQSASNWGRDLIQNFIDGLTAKWNALKETVSNIAQTVKDFLGFSEPKKGPLSNFHTYAPDMMELFAKGIKDNEKLITGQIENSFDFGNDIMGASAARVSSNNVFNISIYGAQGQDERKLADIVIDEITRRTEREKVVFA